MTFRNRHGRKLSLEGELMIAHVQQLQSMRSEATRTLPAGPAREAIRHQYGAMIAEYQAGLNVEKERRRIERVEGEIVPHRRITLAEGHIEPMYQDGFANDRQRELYRRAGTSTED